MKRPMSSYGGKRLPPDHRPYEPDDDDDDDVEEEEEEEEDLLTTPSQPRMAAQPMAVRKATKPSPAATAAAKPPPKKKATPAAAVGVVVAKKARDPAEVALDALSTLEGKLEKARSTVQSTSIAAFVKQQKTTLWTKPVKELCDRMVRTVRDKMATSTCVGLSSDFDQLLCHQTAPMGKKMQIFQFDIQRIQDKTIEVASITGVLTVLRQDGSMDDSSRLEMNILINKTIPLVSKQGTIKLLHFIRQCTSKKDTDEEDTAAINALTDDQLYLLRNQFISIMVSYLSQWVSYMDAKVVPVTKAPFINVTYLTHYLGLSMVSAAAVQQQQPRAAK